MIPEFFVIIGSAIAFLGSIGYLIDTLRGRVRPNRVSFFMWSLAPLVAFFAQVREGVGIQALLSLTVGLVPLLILIASFFNRGAVWKLERFDLACGALSLVGFGLYLVTRIGALAIAFSILADGLAALPTVKKAYWHPETESGLLYLTSATSGALTLLTLKVWTFVNAGFSVYILLIGLVIFALVERRKFLRNP